jgi:alpha-glucosidase
MYRIFLKNLSVLFFVLSMLSSFNLHASEPISVSSPDNNIIVSINIREHLEPYPAGERLYYSVMYRGKLLLSDSPFGLDFKNMPPFAKNLTIINQPQRQVINDTWETVVGKSKVVTNRCNELLLCLQESNPPQRRIDFYVRAYNDGVAFRYYLPDQPAFKEFRLAGERSEFHFTGNHNVWAANYGSYQTHQEAEFENIKLDKISPTGIYGLPFLIQVSDFAWAAITEANITDWAGMYVTGLSTMQNALVSLLSPRLDEPDVAVISQTPRFSPWRVIMIGEKPGDLIESNIVLNLNDPCALKDVSWIKPGISAWDRWWCGSYAPELDFKLGMDTKSMKYFTQFAADMGWEYVLVDWHWYGNPFTSTAIWSFNPDVDITKPIPELDMPELVRFAHERNVKVVLWLEWHHAQKQMDVAFPLYEKWGISGVKIDFMARDDQEMVNFYHRAVKKAAECHLVVDFHGAYKPDGFQRTYPNLITREGVMGNEYNKWSKRVTPRHKVTLPFTRMLAGPMDFTPGGFRHKSEANFVAQDVAPFVMGTRCHELAMLVVYESPFQVMCDSPYNYRGQAGLEFLKVVPTTWDETKVLDGQVGEYICIARRAGKEWFIGSMAGSNAKTFSIPLSFLGPGQYTAHIYYDAPEVSDYLDRLREEIKGVTANDTVVANLAAAGGHVMHIYPAK